MRELMVIFVIISLLEAIGIVGFVVYTIRLKKLSQDSANEKREAKLKIVELNDLVENLQKEIESERKNNAILKNSIKGFENGNSELLSKNTALHQQCESLRIQLSQSDKTIKLLQKQIDEAKEVTKKERECNEELQKKIDAAKEKNEELENANKTAKEQEQKLENASNYINQLQCQLQKVQKQIQDLEDEQEKLIRSKECSDKELLIKIQESQEWRTKYETLKESAEKSQRELIGSDEKIEEKDFSVFEIPTLMFPDDPKKANLVFKDGNYTISLNKLCDLSELKVYLEKSCHEKASRYLKLLEQYIEELQEKFDCINDRCDEDEIATECITSLSQCFESELVPKIIEPSLRSVKDDTFYSDLLSLLYRYMISNSIYSKKVVEGDKYENMSYMQCVPEKTMDATKHKCIKEVLRLPFYARYTDENGQNKEKLLSKGSCVVWTTK